MAMDGRIIHPDGDGEASASSLTLVRLRHGTYHLSVLACNAEDQCSAAPAVLGFLIAPYIWETCWCSFGV